MKALAATPPLLHTLKRPRGRARAVILILAAVVAPVSSPAGATRSHRYVRVIDTTGIPDGVVRLDLPPPVLGEMRSDLGDALILDDLDREIPYGIFLERAGHRTEERSTSVIEMSRPRPTAIALTVRVEDAAAGHNALEIVPASPPFHCRVTATVDGSVTVRFLESLSAGGQTAILYPTSRSDSLHVTLDCQDREEIRQVAVRREEVWAERENVYRSRLRLGAEPPSSVPAQDLMAVLADGPLPVSFLTLSLREPLPYDRPGMIQARTDPEAPWQPAGREAFLAGDDGLARVALARETWCREVRVLLMQEDAPPLAIETLQVSGLARSLVFRTEPLRRYRLLSGAPGVDPPHYPLPDELSRARPDAPLLTPGQRTLNPDYVAPRTPAPWIDAPAWAVWAVLLFAFAVIGLFLWRLFRHAP